MAPFRIYFALHVAPFIALVLHTYFAFHVAPFFQLYKPFNINKFSQITNSPMQNTLWFETLYITPKQAI